jgi:quercetin dioxygenase-like cupin family protein
MNIKEIHTQEKPVSAISLFKSDQGNATAIQILKGEKLKEHITKIPALLVCIDGEVIFENEKGVRETLRSGDYVNIEPMVTHWVEGIELSQLVLIK